MAMSAIMRHEAADDRLLVAGTIACLAIFGQREHWMVLLTLPYIVARGCRLNNSAVSPATGAAIGVAATLGFCIKPYFLLVPIALEVWILAPTRRPSLSIRPETIAMAIAGIVYGALR